MFSTTASNYQKLTSRQANWLARCCALSDPLVLIELRQYRLFTIGVGLSQMLFSQSSKPNEMIFKHNILRV